ncbi:pyruvate carboxylase [Macrococcus bovicus]|uniref:pyruvate carboxylase n=1 Tax=Macrococcus bovicus TaxID=69968 RepID=UPI0025A59625|nr:pyruvate carboxylase [Macrococcus bovicus]WJP98553.1 pyruvate carboxylase [Macrococcus bovicus]
MRQITKLLAANRGEIAIRIFRAATELGIPTVAIYSKEDSRSLHRYKADEAYLVGEHLSPTDSYLDIEGIISIAKQCGADAIHPGYGFLSENETFARRCLEEGIIFIGPELRHLDMFGDKVKARSQATAADLPVIPGTKEAVRSFEEVAAFVETHGYPIIIKAISGGGGKGMRIVEQADELEEAYTRAQSEAQKSFGNREVYLEKLIRNPKHIEVQILGDQHGNLVHLFERDCSVQRRHQKIVEVAPSVGLSEDMRRNICDAAVKLMKKVGYVNAGTVEFLVAEDAFYFIEVNPRVQVEHTITEMVTGVDIVKTQILIADGEALHDARIEMPQQEEIQTLGYAIQCRITTEDPLNHFMPDSGTIMAYRSSGGFGVRLDAGDGFQGAEISPYYDSLLVKVSTQALTFKQAEEKMIRSLKEMRIRGIKTNIQFLINVVQHPVFVSGAYNTNFIDATPELFDIKEPRDRGTKTLEYIASVSVNGFPGVANARPDVLIPKLNYEKSLTGSRQLLLDEGPEAVAKWLQSQKDVLITDTTFRDAHQSLLATRVRTKDMMDVAPATSRLLKEAFSLEMWGGATFDVAYNFLKESPWKRLENLRAAIPNVLFQMLLRASNAVGYKNYADNVIEKFVAESAAAGIDVFRIFDSLNWLDQMKVANEAVQRAGKISEGAICYTGDILNPQRSDVYTLDYYIKMARDMERAGFHILAIKDMAGLLKPEAAYQLVGELKAAVDMPIHLHTHDTSGNGIATYSRAIDAGVDVVDTAIGAMSGLTSQPNAGTLYHARLGTARELAVDIAGLDELSHYWEAVRPIYASFESDIKAPSAEVYAHEMPGGQYSNLRQQAVGVGLGERFSDVKDMYRRVNLMFGDIVKVTPSSKVVGDMALYMVQNDLDEISIYEKGASLDFPASVVQFFKGEIGQPASGFPEKLQQLILKGQPALTGRPGLSIPDVDFAKLEEELQALLKTEVSAQDVISYALYPKVFLNYKETEKMFGDISKLDSQLFFYGMEKGDIVAIEIDKGKTLIVKLINIGHVHADGHRWVYFEMNGMPRKVYVKDAAVEVTSAAVRKADPSDSSHIGAQMPGTVGEVKVKAGDTVVKGQVLLVTEAMKMETSVQAPYAGTIKEINVETGNAVKTGDLLAVLEP